MLIKSLQPKRLKKVFTPLLAPWMVGTALLTLVPSAQANEYSTSTIRVYERRSPSYSVIYNPNHRVHSPVYAPYPGVVRGTIVDSTLINPVVINSPIIDSTLVNPVIIDSSGYDPSYRYGYPTRRSTPAPYRHGCTMLAEYRAACR